MILSKRKGNRMFCPLHPSFQCNSSLQGCNQREGFWFQRLSGLGGRREIHTLGGGERGRCGRHCPPPPSTFPAQLGNLYGPEALSGLLGRTTFPCLPSRYKFHTFLPPKERAELKGGFSAHTPSFSQVSGDSGGVPSHRLHPRLDAGE